MSTAGEYGVVALFGTIVASLGTVAADGDRVYRALSPIIQWLLY